MENLYFHMEPVMNKWRYFVSLQSWHQFQQGTISKAIFSKFVLVFALNSITQSQYFFFVPNNREKVVLDHVRSMKVEHTKQLKHVYCFFLSPFWTVSPYIASTYFVFDIQQFLKSVSLTQPRFLWLSYFPQDWMVHL